MGVGVGVGAFHIQQLRSSSIRVRTLCLPVFLCTLCGCHGPTCI